MKDRSLVSIVIPTYNRKEKLYRLLESIKRSTYPKNKLEVIVVDDSSDESYDDFKKIFPNVTLLKNKDEKFLAETRNIGIKNSNGEYIFIIDDDNIIEKHCIKILVNFLNQNKKIGIAGPLMLYYSDKDLIWCAGIKRNYYTSITTFIGRGKKNTNRYKQPLKSEDFPNALFIRKKVIDEIGFFDSKNFPIHYDEADFCIRARYKNYLVYCIPKAKIWHDIPIAKKSHRSYHLQSKKRTLYTARNRVLFHRMYNTRIQLFIFLTIFLSLISLFYIFTILKSDSNKKLQTTISYLNGTFKGLVYKINEK